jgi:hypothetical protein
MVGPGKFRTTEAGCPFSNWTGWQGFLHLFRVMDWIFSKVIDICLDGLDGPPNSTPPNSTASEH